MPRKTPKLAVLADRIADARRIIDAQQAPLEKLQINGLTQEADWALRTYVSCLLHLLAHQEKLRREIKTKKQDKKISKSRHSAGGL